MSVLVTGGLGAIGSYVVRDLVERGVTVVCYDSRSDTRLIADVLARVNLVEGDLLDFPKLIRTAKDYGAEYIIHTAALMPPPVAANPPQGTAVNVTGTLNVLETARILGLKRVVFASTKGVYAPVVGEYAHPIYRPFDEDYPKDPPNLYDATKLFCEHLGSNYAQVHGVDFVALRFAMTYGPGKLTHGAVAIPAMIVENAMRGLPTALAQGSDQRDDLVYNRDTGRALVLACYAQRLQHRVFHIGTGKGVTLCDLAAAVREIFPEAQIAIGPGLDYLGIGGGLYGVFDISRARRELGYEPRYSLQEGVRDFVETARKSGYA